VQKAVNHVQIVSAWLQEALGYVFSSDFAIGWAGPRWGYSATCILVVAQVRVCGGVFQLFIYKHKKLPLMQRYRSCKKEV